MISSENPFDLIDWEKVNFVTFDTARSRIQGFEIAPLLSFTFIGNYYHTAFNGARQEIVMTDAHRLYLQEEMPNLCNSIPVYYFTEDGESQPLKILYFDESNGGSPSLH